MKTTWMVKAAIAAMMILVLAGSALAFQAAGAPAQPAAATPSLPPLGGGILNGLLSGLIAGVMAVVYGYAKNRNAVSGQMEPFDIKYAWPTMLTGGLLGVIAALLKMSPQDFVTSVTASPLSGAIVFAAEAVLKAIFRHSVPWIRDALDAIKGAPANPTPPAPPKP